MFIHCVIRQVNSVQSILCAYKDEIEAQTCVVLLGLYKDGASYRVETTWLED